ncbi:unnamed protein product [Bursaphelenchus okinawaensis]|uniref:Uncharacterized protein n=1 Tax=Bursaphelenchus okinawaensis TaxID=465554 RepID=A0A811KBN6_9BILA|nr:unnamed protein product [Bursaphelenchus okinawaensis]CAG9097440.1 unnamed protein product [Bursaphelenchus okinawaensis]
MDDPDDNAGNTNAPVPIPDRSKLGDGNKAENKTVGSKKEAENKTTGSKKEAEDKTTGSKKETSTTGDKPASKEWEEPSMKKDLKSKLDPPKKVEEKKGSKEEVKGSKEESKKEVTGRKDVSKTSKRKKKVDSKEDPDKEAKHLKRLNHVPPKPEQIYAELPKKRTFWGYFVPPLYILSIWTLLAAMMFPIMFFIPIIYKASPENIGPGSFLGSVPKLIFEPNVARLATSKTRQEEVETRRADPSKIYYVDRRPITYEPYLTRLRFLLTDEYGPERFAECHKDNFRMKSGCLVDLNYDNLELGYGACAVPRGQTVQSFSFGFEDRQPCIMIRQNKMLHYMPPMVDIRDEVTDERIMNEIRILCEREHYNTAPDGDCCFWYRSQLRCEVQNGDIQIFPSFGVPACHFPYQSGADEDDIKSYQQPIQFVRVSPLKEGDTAEIKCYTDESLKDDENHYVKFTVQIFNANHNAAFEFAMPVLATVSLVLSLILAQ